MTEATSTVPLAERVRAAQLPRPAERKRIRKRAGVSLREVAEEIGVTQTTVWHWEEGRGPSPKHAVRYREVLDALAEAVAS